MIRRSLAGLRVLDSGVSCSGILGIGAAPVLQRRTGETLRTTAKSAKVNVPQDAMLSASV